MTDMWCTTDDKRNVDSPVGRVEHEAQRSGSSGEFDVAIYPDRISVRPADSEAFVRDCRFLGGKGEILVQDAKGRLVQIFRPAHEGVDVPPGSRVALSARPEDVHVYGAP